MIDAATGPTEAGIPSMALQRAWTLGVGAVYGAAAAALVPASVCPPYVSFGFAVAGVYLAWWIASEFRSHRLALDPCHASLQSAATLAPLLAVGPTAAEAWISAQPHPTPTIVAVLAVPWFAVLLAHWILGAPPTPCRPGRRLAAVAIAVWAVAAVLSAWRVLTFAEGEPGRETAYFVQCLWNTLHGRFLAGPVLGSLIYEPPATSHFGTHLSPALLIAVPFFAIVPHALTLHLLRSAALAALVLPCYRIARHWFEPRAALWAALLPLAHPAVWSQPFAPFYVLPFAAFPLLMAVAAVLERRSGAVFLWAAAALMVREDVALPVFALGLWAAMTSRRARYLGVSAIAVAWFVAAHGLIMPLFGPQTGQSIRRIMTGLNEDPTGLLVHNPGALARLAPRLAGKESFLYLVRMLRPTAFAALLSPLAIVAVPSLSVNLIVGALPLGTLELRSHHAVIPAVILTSAAILAVGRMTRLRGIDGRDPWFNALHLQLIAVITLALAALLGVADPRLRAIPPHGGWTPASRAAATAIAEIQPNDSVAAPGAYLPAVAGRAEAYVIDRLTDYPDSPLPDVVLISLHPDDLVMEMDTRQRYRRAVDDLLLDLRYAEVFDRDGIFLLRRRR